jgi:hypothetical protein
MKLQDILDAFARHGYTLENSKLSEIRSFKKNYPEKAAVMTYDEWDAECKASWSDFTRGPEPDIYQLNSNDSVYDRFVLRVYHPANYDGDGSYTEPIYTVFYAGPKIEHHFEAMSTLTLIITGLDDFDEQLERWKAMKRTFRERHRIMDFYGNPLIRWSRSNNCEVYWEMDEHGQCGDKMYLGRMPNHLYNRYTKMLKDREEQLQKEADLTGRHLVWSNSRGHYLKDPDESDRASVSDMLLDSMVKTKVILRKTDEDESRGLLQ